MVLGIGWFGFVNIFVCVKLVDGFLLYMLSGVLVLLLLRIRWIVLWFVLNVVWFGLFELIGCGCSVLIILLVFVLMFVW